MLRRGDSGIGDETVELATGELRHKRLYLVQVAEIEANERRRIRSQRIQFLYRLVAFD